MLPLMAATSFEHRGPRCLLTLGRSTSPPLDQFPVRVCSCPLCIMNRLGRLTYRSVHFTAAKRYIQPYKSGSVSSGRYHARRCHMERRSTRDPQKGPTQGTHTEGTHTEGTHTGDPHRGPAQGTHTGDPHRGEGPTEDPPPEARATQGTHTEHTQTLYIYTYCAGKVPYCTSCATFSLSA